MVGLKRWSEPHMKTWIYQIETLPILELSRKGCVISGNEPSNFPFSIPLAGAIDLPYAPWLA